jgi:hypothetical protein
MSEKTDITERLRYGAGFIVDEVGGVQINLERDEARAESSCAHDQVKQLQNEVRL